MSRKEAEINHIVYPKDSYTFAEQQALELFSTPQETSAWFGGVLEAGAITGIGVSQYTDKRGTMRVKTQPYIEIHSTNNQMLNRLHAVYGGTRKPRFWNKGGQVAAEIVATTDPFTVARQEHGLAMQNWLNAESIDEKVEIARDLKGRRWQQKGSISSYMDLLASSAFVAGVLDSRAYIATRPSRHYHTLSIQLASKNIALLNALESRFGGRTRITEPAGTIVNHGDVVFETKTDTHVWEAIGSEAIGIVKFASNYLLSSLPEEWSYQRMPERQEEVQQLTERVAKHIRMELQLLSAGEIPQLSTDATLSETFGIDKVRISKYLKQALTPDEQSVRLTNIRRFAKRSIDAIAARQIAIHIEQEVSAFQEGKIDRISYKDELADMFGVSARAIKRHVLSHLKSDLQSARLDILRSQITRERNIVYWQRQREENRPTIQP